MNCKTMFANMIVSFGVVVFLSPGISLKAGIDSFEFVVRGSLFVVMESLRDA